MDPGTVLAIVGLVLDVVKDAYEYYSVCKDRNEDVQEARSELLWLKRFFEALQDTLQSQHLNETQVTIVCESIGSCKDTMDKLTKRLSKVKRESPPETVVQKLGDQGRRLLYPFQKGTIVRLLELIAKIRGQMDQVITLLNLDTTAKTLQVVQDVRNLMLSGVKDNDHRKVIDWLNPINQSDIHAAAFRKHEPGTGEWFLGRQEYHDWVNNRETSLRIVGDAGCGKTVLFSSIVERIRDPWSPTSSNCFSAYFYCLYRKGAHHDLAPILRTFIAQLCPQDQVPSSLQQLYDRHSNKFPPGVPSDDELKQTLISIIRELGQGLIVAKNVQNKPKNNIFVLIDALDELPHGKGRQDILIFFNELSLQRLPHLHVITTSRNESDISRGLSSWTSISMDKKMVTEDIRLFVNNELDKDLQLSRQKPAIKSKILHRLVDEGNGMFRWAALQLEDIKALGPPTPRSINRALQTLPVDLNETYERILAKIPTGNSKQAISALTWISFATRPLFVEELIDVCAIDLDSDPEFDSEERFSPQNILDLLPGLITIDPPLKTAEYVLNSTHTITFAHFSVQEYLTGKEIAMSPAQSFALEMRSSNDFIARSCLSYLFCSNTMLLQREPYPLRGYAWDYWAWHATFSPGKSIQEQSKDAEELFKSVAQQDLLDSQTLREKLMAKLSDLPSWQSLTPGKERQYVAALTTPFFYEEFDTYNWVNLFSNRYEFEPLRANSDEIRLLELFPSRRRHTEIRCRIFKVSLDSNPEYDGMSYYWGDPEETEYIRANGLLLEVPKNLVLDLRNLRTKTGNRGRILFVDALCFNIFDPIEQHPRAGLTTRIFKQAQQVAIGLGEKHEDDASAIEFVRRVTSKSITLDNISELFGPEQGYDDWANYIGQSILRLFQRPWWRRVWPVQELILPRKATLYYGDDAITFDTFQRFFEMEEAIKDFIGPASYSRLVSDKAWIGAWRVSNIRNRYHSGGQNPTLSELLWTTEYHRARKRVTKVYGLIGLLSPEEQQSVLLRDIESLSDEEKFSRVAKHLLNKNRNLDILSYASCHRWQGRLQDRHLPSWIPDFGIEGEDIQPLIRGNFGPVGSKDLYDAGTQKKPVLYKLAESPLRLISEGCEIDHIKVVLDSFESTDINNQSLARYEGIGQSEVSVRRPKDQTVLEAFWRAIHADQWHGQRLDDAFEHILAIRSTQNKDPRNVLQPDKIDPRFCLGRRILLSYEGYLCLGPIEAEVNDVIVVLLGGKVPFILRSSGESYTFIGECYVHGIMNGEVIEASERGEYQLKEFCLV